MQFHFITLGSRAPQPFFGKRTLVYALPLISREDQVLSNPLYEVYGGSFVGGGAAEVMLDRIAKYEELCKNITDETSE